MKLKLLNCLVLSLFAFATTVNAQSDTSNYDLGRLPLPKKFTQAVTIKAADLEKMPFTDLKDAINVYINGIYSAKQNYAYVIDGVLNTDINAYSIYDIDEITFIQNAATVLNGVDATRTLILVKTKKGGSEKSGVNVAGQTNLVRASSTYQIPAGEVKDKIENNSTLYHQYYISGYVNTDNVKAGISADIQHNVFPQFTTQSNFFALNPVNSNRFKFNGYLAAKLGERNVLSVNAGYVPQRDAENQSVTSGQAVNNGSYYGSQNLYYTNVKLKTTTDVFVNTLSAGFQHLQSDGHIAGHGYNSGKLVSETSEDTVSITKNYFIKDEINFHAKVGDFILEPNLNFIYRQYTDTSTFKPLGQPVGLPEYFNRYYHKQELALLTPSIAVNYADIAVLQGGVQALVAAGPPTISTRDNGAVLPFASLSVDVLRPFEVDSTEARLMLFGSYARNFNYGSDLYGALLDGVFVGIGNGRNFTPKFDPYQIYNQLQGGLTLSLLNNTLSFSYNYNLKRFSATQVTLYTDPSIVDVYSPANVRIELHRVGIEFNLASDADFKWRSNLNGTYIVLRDNNREINFAPDMLHLIYPGKPFITGGFVNNLMYKNLFLDFSLLYALNQVQVQHPSSSSTVLITGKNNSFDIQSIDLGYKIPTEQFKDLEVYANVRSLIQNNQSTIMERRKFFGGGFKIGF